MSTEAPTDSTGPLAGLRVLDFSHALAGPFCTMLLADLGAEILKVEHPRRGDGTRHMGTPLTEESDSDYFISLNRGKRSVALDLKDPDDLATAVRLAGRSDVVVHNFRPGVMERLGLSYEDLTKDNPELVYAAISGFGERGPLRERGANDITVQAMGGLMSTTGELGGAPLRIGVSVVDVTTGLFAFSSVLAALFHRQRTGEGQRVHVSMLTSAVSLLTNYVPAVLTGGEEVTPSGRQHKQLVPYQAFEAAGGDYIIVGAFTQAFWRRFTEVIGRQDLSEDDRYATNALRVRHRSELIPILEAEMRKRPRDEWLQELEKVDVPCAPVLSVSEALRQEQVAAIGAVTELEKNGMRAWVSSLPIEMSKTPGAPRGFPPRLGEDTEEVLNWLATG